MTEIELNFDISSYEFSDLDLKINVGHLSARDQSILILHLMGHRQRDIASFYNVSRSAISKRLTAIVSVLSRRMR